jgi:O-antigen/teichoic acid export membrane protein
MEEITEKKETHHHEIVKGGVSAFATRLVGMGFSYLFAFLVARMYGAAGSGLYNLSQSLMNVLASITKLGSDTLMTRYGAQYKAEKNSDGSKTSTINRCLFLCPWQLFFP